MTSLTIKEAINLAQNADAPKHAFLADDVAFLLGERLNFSPTQMKINQDFVLTEAEREQFQSDLAALISGQSPQYLLGYSWFFGEKIKVNEHVLIPRFDTEDLVAWVRDDITDSGLTVLDIGTGSGAISVALALQLREKSINVVQTASDISADALTVAQENFADFGLDIQTVAADILTGLGSFDVVISNPPYIKTTETSIMDDNVIQNEPDLALFAGSYGLDFYRKFVKQIDAHLNPGGHFYLEFGLHQKKDLSQIFAKCLPNYQIEFKNDLAGHPRMVKGSKA